MSVFSLLDLPVGAVCIGSMSQYMPIELYYTCLDEVNYLPLTVYSISMNVTHLRTPFHHHIMLVHENILASIVWSDCLDIWQARLNITAEPFTTMVHRRLLDNLDQTSARKRDLPPGRSEHCKRTPHTVWVIIPHYDVRRRCRYAPLPTDDSPHKGV